MSHTDAVGIDLGTTYSCIARLDRHGQPVSIPNQEGELSTPSVVFVDGNDIVVGTEALRNAIAHPDRVIQNAKRFMGDRQKRWSIGDRVLTPRTVAAHIIRRLLDAAEQESGPISQAVITVPAPFSDAERHATIQAGHDAGLQKVEIINEPVAAALCHVLGSEGLGFTELAIDQQLLIFDLGGGTLDLAVVHYASDEVRVVASDGDLELGGIDWTRVLANMAAERFLEDIRDDPRRDPESHQALFLEAEQAKRSLSVRPRAVVTVQHGGHRRACQISRDEFQDRCQPLLNRCEIITRRILKKHRFGWAHIDAVLVTGGASRMPMVRERLQEISGRTLNTTLSPDQSIAHGAAYYAGMLLSNSQSVRTVFDSRTSKRLSKMRQRPVNSRSLGIMVRDDRTGRRIPYYLIPANTPLPVSRTHTFGTVVDHQTSVRVRVVESGTGPDKPITELGDCRVTGLPPGLPEGSRVDVTISYDTQARVHVAARELTTNRSAEAEFVRLENFVPPPGRSMPMLPIAGDAQRAPAGKTSDRKDDQRSPDAADESVQQSLETLAGLSQADEPPSPDASEEAVLLRCTACGRPLNIDGECDVCLTDSQALRKLVESADDEPTADNDPPGCVSE